MKPKKIKTAQDLFMQLAKLSEAERKAMRLSVTVTDDADAEEDDDLIGTFAVADKTKNVFGIRSVEEWER